MAAVRRWLTARLPAVLLPPSLKDAAHASRRRTPAPRLASARTHARALKRAWRTYAATLGLDGQASAGARDAEAARGAGGHAEAHGAAADGTADAAKEAAREAVAAAGATAQAAARGVRPAVAELWRAGLTPYREAVREFAQGFREGAQSLDGGGSDVDGGRGKDALR